MKVGKYEIAEEIGRGAMGIIYRARDRLLDRYVVVKVISSAVASDFNSKQLFEREAKMVARLSHPNIINIYDFGYTDDGQPYMAMELLDGDNLKELVKTRGLTSYEKLNIVIQICKGLAHAHERGIVHRDIKPANIFVTKQNAIKITDFGVSLLTDSTITLGVVRGTPEYMSPEQVKSEKLDGRSDVFSVGTVLFWLITGESPFSANSVDATMYKIVHENPRQLIPSELPGVDLFNLRRILNRALEKNVDKRYQSVLELASELEPLASSLTNLNGRETVASGITTVRNNTTASSESRSQASPQTTPETAVPGETPANKRSRFRSLLREWPRWIIYALGAAFLIFLLYVSINVYKFLRDFNDAVNILTAKYGVNTWLAKAIGLALLTPLGWGIKNGFFKPWKRKFIFRMFTVVYACLYFLSMYAISRNVSFAHETGEVLQWYAVTPEGVRFFDSPGYDPKYGIKLKPATPELKIAIARQKLGQIPNRIPIADFQNMQLFDVLTGDPRCWFYRTEDGGYELFDGPGIHPQNGQTLLPVTPEIAHGIEKWLEKKEADAMAATERQRQAVEAQKQAEQEKARLAFIDRYVDRSITRSVGVNQSAILMANAEGQSIPELVTSARAALLQKGYKIVNAFRPSVFRDQIYEGLYAGDASLINRLDLNRLCNSIIIGKLSSQSSQSSEMEGLVTARVSLTVRVINVPSGQIHDEFRIDQKGGGFSIEAAESQALQRLAATLEKSLISRVSN